MGVLPASSASTSSAVQISAAHDPRTPNGRRALLDVVADHGFDVGRAAVQAPNRGVRDGLLEVMRQQTGWGARRLDAQTEHALRLAVFHDTRVREGGSFGDQEAFAMGMRTLEQLGFLRLA